MPCQKAPISVALRPPYLLLSKRANVTTGNASRLTRLASLNSEFITKA
jgi:hypothetical protein